MNCNHELLEESCTECPWVKGYDFNNPGDLAKEIKTYEEVRDCKFIKLEDGVYTFRPTHFNPHFGNLELDITQLVYYANGGQY